MNRARENTTFKNYKKMILYIGVMINTERQITKTKMKLPMVNTHVTH